MAVLQMQRFSICALKKDRKAILEELQSLGVMEINSSMIEDDYLQKVDTVDARQTFEKNAVLADHALEVLQEYAPEKTSLFAALEGKALVDKATFAKAQKNRNEILGTANHLLDLKKQIAEKRASIVKLETQIESLLPWLSLDVPMNCRGTKSTTMLIGSIGSVLTLEEVYAGFAAAASEVDAVDIHVVSADKDQTCLAVACLTKDAAKAEEALRTLGFSRPSHTYGQTPGEKKQELERQIASLEKEITDVEGEIRSYEKSRNDLRLISDYFRLRAQKYEVLGDLWQSRQTFFVTGYIPAKRSESLKKRLSESFEAVVDIEEVTEDEEVPVALENGKFASSVEGVVASFGLPGKGEMDPSKLMSIFYVFLFGLMLSDAAYGLIVFAACAFALKKFPRMSDGMAKSIRLFMYCGLSTLFWGIMFGGYFGDVVNVVSRTFFGAEVAIAPVWFAPLDDPMRLLIYSLLFGLIHLFAGLGAKGYMCIRDKKYLDFFCDVVLWYMMLIGLLIMLLPSSLFYSISKMAIAFPPVVNTLGKVLAIAGALGLLFMSGRANKNPALRIALGAYDLYNITGWLSDILSYSRLLALGLATGVIASVVNTMGSMAGGGIVGAILFIIVFIVGHTLNLAINLLGAYVHTCRLQYVEFFGKFFEGGGVAFAPFKANTKYVDIKEETKL